MALTIHTLLVTQANSALVKRAIDLIPDTAVWVNVVRTTPFGLQGQSTSKPAVDASNNPTADYIISWQSDP